MNKSKIAVPVSDEQREIILKKAIEAGTNQNRLKTDVSKCGKIFVYPSDEEKAFIEERSKMLGIFPAEYLRIMALLGDVKGVDSINMFILECAKLTISVI